MNTPQLATIKADLHRYLSNRKSLLSLEFNAVVEDVAAFTSAVICEGFDRALAALPNFFQELLGRPFIEVADVIAEHHLRFAQTSERDVVRKSLLEAYIHAAGPQYVFRPPDQKRILRSLRRAGPRNFVAMLFSLHVFNLISMAIEDEVRVKMTDVTTFELYMLGVETICQTVVKGAVKNERTVVDERWVKAVAMNIEAQLLNIPLNRRQSRQSMLSGHKK